MDPLGRRSDFQLYETRWIGSPTIALPGSGSSQGWKSVCHWRPETIFLRWTFRGQSKRLLKYHLSYLFVPMLCLLDEMHEFVGSVQWQEMPKLPLPIHQFGMMEFERKLMVATVDKASSNTSNLHSFSPFKSFIISE